MAVNEERQDQPFAEGEASADRVAETASAEGTKGDGGLESLKRDLDEANRKLQEYLGLAQRTQADFVNYRRRVEVERGESMSAGKAALAHRILPVIDDFDRALKHVPADVEDNDWVKGISHIARKLAAALEAEGIVHIQALGEEFTPWEHEALMHSPSTDDEAGKVIEVYREGYKQGDRVLRPAQVIVGKGSQ
jgi:molecular chaperone GrpE